MLKNCNKGNREEEEEEEFYRLLLPLLSYGTILAVERQTCLTCRGSIRHLYVHMMTQDTARDETDTGC